MFESIGIILSLILMALPFIVPLMWYSKEPVQPSWYKDGKQLFEEQQNDPFRKKLSELARNKNFIKVNDRLYISKEISEDLKLNEAVLGRVLNAGRGYIKSKTGYQDLRVTGIVDSDSSTSYCIVKNLNGEVIFDDDRKILINKNDKYCQGVEVEFKWVAMDKDGAIAAVAFYPSFIKKVIQGVSLKFKELI